MDTLKQRAAAEIKRLGPRLKAVSLAIHAHPELAFEEHRAAGALMRLVRSAGFRVERGVGGLPTAFRAVAPAQKGAGRGAAGPTIAFLAEYDALPGIGHACGHNLIGVASCGAAMAMARVLPRTLPGRVVVIGTPAEERGGGKIRLAKRGVFRGVAAAMMVHPSNTTEVIKRALAMIPVRVEFFGRAAHAAASPERGVNALDALVLTFSGINALRQHLSPDARIHGIVTHGGQVPNIIPDYAAGRWLIRALRMADALRLRDRVRACAEGAAAATGARLRMTIEEEIYEPFEPNRALAELFRANLARLGMRAEAGREDREIGSSDIGNVSQRVPTIHPALAISPRHVPIHTPQFAKVAGSRRGLDGMLTAATALAWTALDLLADPAALRRVRAEHAACHRSA